MTRGLRTRLIVSSAAPAFLRVLCVLCGLLLGCDRQSAKPPPAPVTLYTSVDEPVARAVTDAFTAKTGIPVTLLTDTEASKSVGLAERLRAEKGRPIAHVWWGNEVFHTVALADEGHFAPLDGVPGLDAIRREFRDPRNRWAGVGLRARVLAVAEDTGRFGGSIRDLADPRFKDKIVLARPTAGTTGGHVAALYALWGDVAADDFFRKLKANGAQLVGGNSVVAQQVGNGNFALGLTDNDDVTAAGRSGGELWQVVPDQGPDGIGTLAIPTTVAVVARPDSPPGARELAAYLLSDEAEWRLRDAGFAAFSVRPDAPVPLRTMRVDYAAVAKKLPDATRRATAILDGRE